jgi:hypothetical protein
MLLLVIVCNYTLAAKGRETQWPNDSGYYIFDKG